MTPCRIRPYRAEDRADCERIFFRAVREGTTAFYDATQRAAWAPDDEQDDGPDDGPDKLLDQWCWVAETESGPVGFMSLEHGGYLDMAFVLPEVQGRGVAAALYDRLIAQARTAGLAQLSVHASHLARRFLARRGWRVAASEDIALRGAILQRFFMTVQLEEDSR